MTSSIKTKGFHGIGDTAAHQLATWQVTSRRLEHEHVVRFSRRLFYRFRTHVHPYVERLRDALARGVAELQAMDTRRPPLRADFFQSAYNPKRTLDALDTEALGTDDAVAVYGPHPVKELDFDYAQGAYAVYNWELFFHVPYTLGLHLSKSGRFADAQRWFHYIFDPTDNSDPKLGPKRFWKVKPFELDEVEHIEKTLANLATGDDPALRASTVRTIGAWRDQPLRPHLVARTRPAAYMYATVMAYLDNLIAWGDSLFRQDTPEAINEAMQHYVLAANILGPRPQLVPKPGTPRPQTYASLKRNLDEFGNAAVALEAELAFDLFPPAPEGHPGPEETVVESIGRSLYFCIPRNAKFIGYWDTVGDRLFKIRNSLNLTGALRQLPLFTPPIDPAVLARAVAAGVDVTAIAAGAPPKTHPVRFPVLLQKALEMTQEVKALGAQILAAIEKRDGEMMSVLRARHEGTLVGMQGAIKYAQWQEASKVREGIEVGLRTAFERYRHYDRLLGGGAVALPGRTPLDAAALDRRAFASEEPVLDAPEVAVEIGESFRDGGHKLSPTEARELDLHETAQILQDASSALEGIGAALSLIPQFAADIKFMGIGPGVTFGGNELGNLFRGLASVARAVGARTQHEAGMAGRMASFERREQEWAWQRKVAAGEVTQLYTQLRAAELREHIAKRDHDNHATQVAQATEVLEFLTDHKVTTAGFYLWLKGELQTLHAQAFQFAYELASRAQAALKFELARDAAFLQTTYLAGHEGLFAGERLHLDLKRMEMAYLEQATREYEITKHVSLREWYPVQLMELRATGACAIELPEEMFDLDCPGHMFRRIRSVALSIPCVTGPYASVNAGLLLASSAIRTDPNAADLDTSYQAVVTAVVTSSPQGDTGTFGDARDERPQPFEGAGAVGRWNVALLGEPRTFDYDTIADLVLTIRYTARDGRASSAAKAAARDWLARHAARLFSLRHELSNEWQAYRRTGTLKLELTAASFPYRFTDRGFTLGPARRLRLYYRGEPGAAKLLRDGALLEDLGTPTTSSTVVASFDPIGTFELVLANRDVEDIWMIVDWSES